MVRRDIEKNRFQISPSTYQLRLVLFLSALIQLIRLPEAVYVDLEMYVGISPRWQNAHVLKWAHCHEAHLHLHVSPLNSQKLRLSQEGATTLFLNGLGPRSSNLI